MAAAAIDLAGSKADGFEWYPWSFFGNPVPGVDQFVASRTLGSLGVTGGAGTHGGQLCTAAKTATGDWVGTTFAGGGYFEADLSFDPELVNTEKSWPAFWSMAIEHLVGGDEQWPGQAPGFAHFIEVDFFEYLVAEAEGANAYGANLHDWYGIWPDMTNAQLPYSQVVRRAPQNTDWKQRHKLGGLWKPATASAQGSMTFYFDDVQVGQPATWDRLDPSSAPPPGGSKFGILDHQRLALIVGSGVGHVLQVHGVRVWQR